MPSQYPSESRLSSRRGGKMVSVAHSPRVNGKAGREDATSHCAGKEGGKEPRARRNGMLPHPVIVRAKPSKLPAPRLSIPAPAPAPTPSGPRPTPPVVECQTQAQPTPQASTVPGGEGGRSVCSQAALSYTTAILARRAERTLCRQRDLDHRLQQLRSRVRGRQGRAVCRHVGAQILSARERREVREGQEGKEGGIGDAIPMQVDGAIEDISVSRGASCVQYKSCDSIDQLKCEDMDQSKLDIDQSKCSDVDQSKIVSEDIDRAKELKVANVASDSLASDKLDWSQQTASFRSHELKIPSDRRSQVVERWRQQLSAMCEGGGGEGGGGEVTEGSSDEEGGEACAVADTGRRRLQRVCRKWEHSRGPIGAQWAWLRHRITQLNQQLAQLDSTMQRRPAREPLLLSSPALTPRSLVSSPCIWSVGGDRGRVMNGVGHTPSVPHLLIPDGLLNSPIQVKDLLSPSPLTNTMSFVLDDGGYTCARARPLQRRPTRKVVRLRQKNRPRHGPAPQPVLPRDTPSWVWLDEGVQQVMRDHPYASMPRPKRYRRPGSGRSRTVTLSPSPGVCEGELSTKSIGVRRPHPLPDISPRSPSLSRSSTPIPLPPPLFSGTQSLPSPLTPSLPRKKRPSSHTPSYDIDSIVIPYSVAAATRLEKLEYKEIVTPRWRELETTPTSHTPRTLKPSTISARSDEIEGMLDEVFAERHKRYESTEKKRFMHFISGGQRKRTRPLSLSSTPDPLQNSPMPPAKARRTTLDPLQNSPMPPAKARRTTLPASPTEPPSLPPPVLSWPPRSFPLLGADLDALTNPPPPPPLPLPAPRTSSSSSPSPLLSRPLTPSLPHTPSTSSVLATPLATPLSSPSTPFGESPMSPSEWAVNSQLVPPKPSSVAVTGAIVLRLTKKT